MRQHIDEETRMVPQQESYDAVVVGGSGVDTIVRVAALPVPLATP